MSHRKISRACGKIAAAQPFALGNPEQQAVKEDRRLTHQRGDGATGNTCEAGQQKYEATALRGETAYQIGEERTLLGKQASDLCWGMRHETETTRKRVLSIAQRRRPVNAAAHPGIRRGSLNGIMGPVDAVASMH